MVFSVTLPVASSAVMAAPNPSVSPTENGNPNLLQTASSTDACYRAKGQNSCALAPEGEIRLTDIQRALFEKLAPLMRKANSDFTDEEIKKFIAFREGKVGEKIDFEKQDHASTGLCRNVFVSSNATVIHLNKKKRGDRVYGSGGQGKVKPGILVFHSGEVVPIAIKSMSRRSERSLTEALLHYHVINQWKEVGLVGCKGLVALEKKVYLFIEKAECDVLTAVTGRVLEFSWKVVLALNCIAPIIALHQRKFIHRDIKGGNFLLLKEAEGFIVKLGDFGYCRPEEGAVSWSGTACHFPPECFLGQPPTRKMDIWGFGCILAALFLKKGLFDLPWIPQDIEKLDQNEILRKMQPYFQKLRPDWQSQIPSTGSFELDVLMRKIFQINPEDRPTAEEIFDSLEALLKALDSSASSAEKCSASS